MGLCGHINMHVYLKKISFDSNSKRLIISFMYSYKVYSIESTEKTSSYLKLQ